MAGFLGKRLNVRFNWAFLVLALPIAYNAQYLVNQFAYVDPFRYLSGKLSRDEYIAKFRPEYDAMKFLNESLPKDAKVLFAFVGDRGYYCEKDYFFGESVLGSVFQKRLCHLKKYLLNFRKREPLISSSITTCLKNG